MKLLGSSPSINGIKQVISRYWYGATVTLIPTGENTWDVANLNGVRPGYHVIQKKSRYRFVELPRENGRRSFYASVFAGPSPEQTKRLAKQRDVQEKYMDWLYSQPGGSSNVDPAKAATKYAELLRDNPRRRPKVWSRKALGLPARFGYADDPDAVDFITGKTPVEMGIKMKKARAPRATGTKPTVARFYRDPDTIDMFRPNPRRRRNPPRPTGWGTGTKYRFSPLGIGNENQVRIFCTSSLPSEYMPPPWVYGTVVGLMVGTRTKGQAESLAKWFVAQPSWAWAEAMKTKKGTWYVAARAWDSIHQALQNVTPF